MEIVNNVEEQIFCLKFELDAFSKHVLYHDHERWVHGYMNIYGEQLHLNRYKFAVKYLKDKVVLDIAGGSGYGTYYLAIEGNPLRIDSVDLNESSVKYAQLRYPHRKIERVVGNAETFVRESFYDVIVSFETIEHLNNYRKFIDNVFRSLKPNGTLIISTPIAPLTSTKNINPYHVIEWTLDDFQLLMSEKFAIREVFVQNIVEKKDIVNTLFKRVLSKITPDKFKKKFSSEIVKFGNQYNSKNIVSGFQILVCTRI